MPEKSTPNKLLDIRNLNIWYSTDRGEAKAVNGLDMLVERGEIFGLAGESGCGKSTLITGIMRLTKLPAHVQSGEVVFYYSDDYDRQHAADLLALSQNEMRELRWRNISYIPQSAMNVLNPVLKIEEQIIDVARTHSKMTKKQAQERVAEQLEMVGLGKNVAKMYPHELSGGMKQRVTIASAVVLKPELLIADEPTTALDVNVQRVILQELIDIREKLGLTILYVTHDMAVHAEIADRIGIMYAGLIVEIGPANDVLREPLHPYSRALVESIPEVGGKRKRIEGLPGVVPSPLEWPGGCAFHPRCSRVMNICREKRPVLREVTQGRMVACHLYE
jgi:peptide/nickel transport system ATP-binding protein